MSYGGGAEYVASHRRHVTLKKAMDDTLAQHTWAASLPPHPPSRTSRTSSLATDRPTDVGDMTVARLVIVARRHSSVRPFWCQRE